MQEIKCPKCGEPFQIDESGYAAILKQVRDREFEKEISQKKADFLQEKENAVALAVSSAESEKDKLILSLRSELALSKEKIDSERQKALSEGALSLAEKDMNKIVGREYVGLGLVADKAFCRVTMHT